MDTKLLYNVLTNILSMVAVAAIMINNWNNYKKKIDSKLFYSLCISLLLVLITDTISWIIDGKLFAYDVEISFIVNTLCYFTQIAFSYFCLLLSYYWYTNSIYKLKKIAIYSTIPLIIEAIIVIVNIWTRFIFDVDENNYFITTKYFFINTIPFVFYFYVSFGMTLYKQFPNSNYKQAIKSIVTIIIISLPLLICILAMVIFEICYTGPFTIMMLIILHLNHQKEIVEKERYERLVESERVATMQSELTQSKISIMLSQIQPHFLYNALCVIQDLCHDKAPEAEEATIEFSQFLRANLDSLSDNKPIKFEQELFHTKNYLSLEKKRFGDRLTINYDIKTMNFHIPSLTLQPLVENAVRYGILKKEDGGTVTISTDELPDFFIVVVNDDGIGFDIDNKYVSGRSHIGIKNVRDRLKKMIDGDLIIKSEINVGTSVQIYIPKEKI